jgi:hypothetical protein
MKRVADLGEASKAGRLGRAMFDGANQPCFTLATVFIFAPNRLRIRYDRPRCTRHRWE